MAYATLAQIQAAAGGRKVLVALADQDGDGVPDAAVIAQAQAEVDGEIDGYAGKRYAVPLAAPSAALQAASAAGVVYWLRRSRSMLTEVDTDTRADRVKWFEAIAKGHVVPSDPLPAAASTSRSAWVEREESAEVTSRANLEGAW